MTTYTTLQVDQIDESVIEMIEDIVDGWYIDDKLDTYGFLDRLESWLLNRNTILPSQMDDPVIKKILRIARKYKKEVGE